MEVGRESLSSSILWFKYIYTLTRVLLKHMKIDLLRVDVLSDER